jgi:hypothetical protein
MLKVIQHISKHCSYCLLVNMLVGNLLESLYRACNRQQVSYGGVAEWAAELIVL